MKVLRVKDEHRVIKDSVRETIADLVGVEGVSANSSFRVFKKCATLAGMEVVGSWHRCSIPRIMLETTEAVEIMIVKRILESIGLSSASRICDGAVNTHTFTGLTFSGDGASHNNIQFSAQHITTAPTDLSHHPKDLFMGVHPELNHTTNTQLEGWKDIIDNFCVSYNTNPDAKCSIDPASIWQRVHGYLGDHAADQKKLSSKLEAFRQECDQEVRGKEALVSDDLQDDAEWDSVFDEKLEEMFEKAGGQEQWASLSPGEHHRSEKEMIQQVQITLGEQAYERLSPEEKADADFWAYTGCTMHKDLNAMKGGVGKMAGSWEVEKRTLPIMLASKAEATATKSVLAPKKGKCGRQPERGGIKLASLLGALVKHKNQSKGHQARFRIYCRKKLGFKILFPDTSNNCYQSHGYAATEIVHRQQLYIDFLSNVQDQKAMSGGLNHMEENVLNGLGDDASFTELQVLTLYSQVISLPLSQLARAPYHQSRNGLDLGGEFD